MPKVIATKEDWIRKGIEKFAHSGERGLIIDQMSKELGCSKSSFYWYFEDRSDFIARIVERWSEIATEDVIRSSSAPENVVERITTMLKHMFSATRKGDFLFYLRKWSEESQSFQTELATIERTRMNYAKELFVRAGMSSETAESKSFILYHYYLGWYERHKNQRIGEEELRLHIEQLRMQLLGL
ncbi:TetR/AcrR family transcriptional regulator [Paenibacillus nanensis]|uniref:TetR/AcrR family transcriptional regulator n=1 Tax=Paenibacillus nanensis TaxID=393251 RepID=A0A3A1VRD3_9BACL|nr:TetR/AcrR family transcriptional regulator [Paenibacillus nanensis]RIX60060.1 TetR/AcrR family transcriptional regulator [Paenibacillus nanensis]